MLVSKLMEYMIFIFRYLHLTFFAQPSRLLLCVDHYLQSHFGFRPLLTCMMSFPLLSYRNEKHLTNQVWSAMISERTTSIMEFSVTCIIMALVLF